MVPVPISARNPHPTRILYLLLSLGTQYAPRFVRRTLGDKGFDASSSLVRRDTELDHDDPKFIVFAVLIPVLVLLSGLFAGLTLGYMSLDETQLNVLSISGTPEQRKYATQIIPVRKNGHLLLVTLLLANMIVNETLPVIADPVLNGGFQGVVVSTVLIVIFSEIIPQSLFTRHGLYLGAKMARFTQLLIYLMAVIAWPVAKILEFVLGPHHGIIYRRAELKELIAMHSSQGRHGGDLKTDTVAIIGATLDLQEKVVKQAMTPIEDVFMLSINSKLDYDLLKKICRTGHSRIPVYEELDVPVRAVLGPDYDDKKDVRTVRVKKIVGILLVKQCVLLDPKEATPLRKLPLNKVPFVPNNESLLGILDKFQEGRSHMAIVSRFSVEKAASVKKAVKSSLTQRLRARVGMRDTDSESESSGDEEKGIQRSAEPKRGRKARKIMEAITRKDSSGSEKSPKEEEGRSSITDGGETAVAPASVDVYVENPDALTKSEAGMKARVDVENVEGAEGGDESKKQTKRRKIGSFQLPKLSTGMTSMSALEQSMPADAVLTKESAAEFLQGFDPAVMPLGIITLEDVLEELIGEEIYDEFDTQGAHGDPYQVPPIRVQDVDGTTIHQRESSAPPAIKPESIAGSPSQGSKTSALKGLGFFRTRSAPPIPRDQQKSEGGEKPAVTAQSTDESSGPTIQMPRPIKGAASRSPPSVILEQHSSLSSNDDQVTSMLVNAGNALSTLGAPSQTESAQNSAKPPTRTSSEGQISAAPSLPPYLATLPPNTSRSGSPAPLEAILLERKRRLHGGQGAAGQIQSPAVQPPPFNAPQGVVNAGSLGPSISTGSGLSGQSASPSPAPGGGGKGAKFKSSPLGGMDRGGVVVAEQVGAAYSPSPSAAAQTKEVEVKEDRGKED